MRILAIALIALLLPAISRAAVVSVPRYAHIIVIVDENKDYRQIMNGPDAPNIQRLAKTYGAATNFFAETHPSEPNYVALVGGDRRAGDSPPNGWIRRRDNCGVRSTETPAIRVLERARARLRSR